MEATNPVIFNHVDDQHLLGRIHSQLAGSVVDGPGWRYVVFMQGCQMRCLYCHNRDSWGSSAGEFYTVSEIVEKILPYAIFFNTSSGGVTVSGGEPLLQHEFVDRLFTKLQQQNIHTCLDTNGFWPSGYEHSALHSLLDHTDLVMLDVKQLNPQRHQQLTGIALQKIQPFIAMLKQREKRVRLRYVVVPGYTDANSDIQALGEFARSFSNLEKIELLPYHRMGVPKWQALGEVYPLQNICPPSHEKVLSIKDYLQQQFGLPVLL